MLAASLDAFGFAVFFVGQSRLPRGGTPSDEPGEGFFSDPVHFTPMVLAAAALIAAGVVAAVSLWKSPLQSRAGRWATRFGLVFALMNPAVLVPVSAIAWVIGYDLPQYWAEPLGPLWLLSGLVAVVLGAVAREPGRRGALLVPFVIGAFVVTFALGEVLSQH